MNDKPERKSELPGPMQSASGAGASNAERACTLADLIARFTLLDPSTVEARVAAIPTQELVASGARASAARVIDDGVNLVGRADTFLRTATREQRMLLATITPEFLACTVTAIDMTARKDRAARRQNDAGKQHRHGARATAGTTLTFARSLRDVLYENVRTLAAGDATAGARLDAAWGSSETHDEVADSLAAMVSVGRELLANVKGSREGAREVEALFERAETLAEKVRATAAQERAKVSGAEVVTGAEIDRWGGIALWFLGQLARLFHSARKTDPTIPRLPVVKLRGVILRKNRKRSAAKEPVPEKSVDATKSTPPKG